MILSLFRAPFPILPTPSFSWGKSEPPYLYPPPPPHPFTKEVSNYGCKNLMSKLSRYTVEIGFIHPDKVHRFYISYCYIRKYVVLTCVSFILNREITYTYSEKTPHILFTPFPFCLPHINI